MYPNVASGCTFHGRLDSCIFLAIYYGLLSLGPYIKVTPARLEGNKGRNRHVCCYDFKS